MRADAHSLGVTPYSPHATAFLDWRLKSPLRGPLVVLANLAVVVALSHFPALRPNLWIALPTLAIALGTWDTLRNLHVRWDMRQAGLVLCVYMDMMALFIALFCLVYPYFNLSAGSL
ncbi:permease [Granulicella cerasi]|uniref:Permease n=1 Tax=Granulicella cerasi TaxID=741063 RepID=A0ABW1Z5V4_9BACT|nr:permease [Granulicella cerasi]